MSESLGLGLGIFIVFMSLCLTAFFSLTETAVTSISSLKAKHIQELGGKKAQVLNLWLNHPHRLLASLLIGSNLAIIFGSIFADEIITTYFGKSSIFLVSGGMTIVIVLFAEVIPKSFAKTYAFKIIVPVLNIYRVIYFVLKPFAILMTYISSSIQGLFLKENKNTDPQITEEELEFLIDVGEQEGVIAEQKHEMLSGIFELGDTVVREIMVHRIDLAAVAQSKRVIDVVDKFRETGLSRIAVFEDKIDNITGFIHVKDVLYYIKKHLNEDKSVLEQAAVLEIKRDVMFVPETKPLDLLFQEMRRQKQQMAIVLDEYGGTSGVVTMEDIFEEIVGEVRDEFDNEEDAIRPTQLPNSYLVECKIHIEDFCDFFDIKSETLTKDLPSHEFDTLGGYVLHYFGQIPKAGDKLNISQNLSIEVVEVSKRRVRRVVARLNEQAASIN
ncbi:MAG: hemolysin family protein [Bdellovibrionota bacterium]